ncbi:hypothetical protein C8J57DRAFT_1250475 [Mycena rebaudengoi]|nr:hypothetical protein C8J57DRAFT_1250475 [Mycena rebaudengoi]
MFSTKFSALLAVLFVTLVAAGPVGPADGELAARSPAVMLERHCCITAACLSDRQGNKIIFSKGLNYYPSGAGGVVSTTVQGHFLEVEVVQMGKKWAMATEYTRLIVHISNYESCMIVETTEEICAGSTCCCGLWTWFLANFGTKRTSSQFWLHMYGPYLSTNPDVWAPAKATMAMDRTVHFRCLSSQMRERDEICMLEKNVAKVIPSRRKRRVIDC